MAAISLNNEESQKLVDVVEKVKNSKAYKNYLAGVGLSLKRAASLKGEGDAFAKIGETLRSGKIPQFLNATAKGQQKVQDALFAELKQQKLHGLLKDEEFNDTIYRELYVKPGTLKDYLGMSSQEEQMSENNENNVKPETLAEENAGLEELVALPDYYDEEKFKDLNIVPNEGKISKKDLEKLEKRHEEMLEAEKSSGRDAEKQSGDDETLDGKDGVDSKDGAIEVDGMEGEGPRTTENEDADWVKQYDEALSKYGQANGNEWVRDNEPDENGERPAGLKGKFANGTEVHYADKDKLSVKTPEGEKPNADHFKEIIALAKDNNQEIKLGTTMTPEFKAALIEACAKGGIEMQGLSAEDREVYDSFKPQEEKQEEKTEEKTEPAYQLNPLITKGRLTEYSGKVYSADRYSMRAVNAGNKEFDAEIAKMEENLSKGWYKATGEDKAKAEILLKKYTRAEATRDVEGMKTYETALKFYGLDSISREPEDEGSYVVKGKPYGERTEEEKANINAAMEKAFPKKQEMDSTVLQAMKEAKGQTKQ